jgi:DNA-binding response OmpR family regulator
MRRAHPRRFRTHLLQVAVRNLRAKLAVVIPDTVIGTVYGLGYRLVET